MLRLASAALLLAGVIALAGCKSKNAGYCDLPGDCPVANSTCDMHSCVAPGEPDAAAACDATHPCATGECNLDQGMCVQCLTSDQCTDPTAPVCTPQFSCGDCMNDNECMPRFAGQPFCVGGDCAECKTSANCPQGGTKPVCGADGACTACTADAQCAEGVCDTGSGHCFGVDEILYVQAGATGSSCSKAMPCGSLSQAESQLDASHKVIKVKAGTYTDQVVFNNETARVVGDGAGVVAIKGGATDKPVVQVSGTSDVSISGVTLRLAIGTTGADGLLCSGAGAASTVVRLDDVTVELNADNGIEAQGCQVITRRSTIDGNVGEGVVVVQGALDMDRTMVHDNHRGGMRLDTSDFAIVNSFVVKNGRVDPVGSDYGGLKLIAPSAASVMQFSTVASNSAKNAAAATGILCVGGGAAMSGDSVIIAANTVQTGTVDQVAGPCTWTHTLLDTGTPLGGTNLMGDPKFVSTTDWHIQTGSACAGQGTAGSVTVDYDGETRPAPAGSMPDCGADEIAQ
jgi:hypothetical protein